LWVSIFAGTYLTSFHLKERKYATWRILLLWLLSGLGGNFFSALFEDKCTLVVGASGAVFGMVGLFVGDFMLNFETIKRWVSIAHVCPLTPWFSMQSCNPEDSQTIGDTLRDTSRWNDCDWLRRKVQGSLYISRSFT
jgi:hypothetical protein